MAITANVMHFFVESHTSLPNLAELAVPKNMTNHGCARLGSVVGGVPWDARTISGGGVHSRFADERFFPESERISNGRGGTDLPLSLHLLPHLTAVAVTTMLLITLILLGCSLLAGPAGAAERLASPPVRKVKELALRQHRATRSASVEDVGECILLFGPFCNGESMGVSRVSMMR